MCAKRGETRGLLQPTRGSLLATRGSLLATPGSRFAGNGGSGSARGNQRVAACAPAREMQVAAAVLQGYRECLSLILSFVSHFTLSLLPFFPSQHISLTRVPPNSREAGG